MASPSGDRSAHWPAIERRYGHPMDHWFALMKTVQGRRYPEQMALLQEEHGFSRAHANAVVQFCRGSVTTRKFETLDDYLADREPAIRATVESIFSTIRRTHPDLDLVIAWNQPMLKAGDDYVFGVGTAKAHILLAPWGTDVLQRCAPLLEGYTVNKKTVRVPAAWDVDAALLEAMIGLRLEELGRG
jgi:uncharacterized protein YdhG (YjbR/CyaY superfamily)